MKTKKIIFLALALLSPICIFVFLKLFGKNEFDVPPLYSTVYPEGAEACGGVIHLPYSIPDSVQTALKLYDDSLTLIHMGELTHESNQQINRIKKIHGKEVKFYALPSSDQTLQLKRCVFFLQGSYDLVLLDREGVIRGQYVSSDREEIDRLLTEIAILFKRY